MYALAWLALVWINVNTADYLYLRPCQMFAERWPFFPFIILLRVNFFLKEDCLAGISVSLIIASLSTIYSNLSKRRIQNKSQ